MKTKYSMKKARIKLAMLLVFALVLSTACSGCSNTMNKQTEIIADSEASNHTVDSSNVADDTDTMRGIDNTESFSCDKK